MTPTATPAPRVSVVVPALNAARFLPAALDSALAQDVALEVIVTDDGSTDETPAIATAAGERVRLLRQSRRGPSAARNAALAVARGDYVALLDADDRFLPGKLARQVALLDARPDVGLAYTGWRFIDDAGRVVPGSHGWSRDEGDVLERLVLGNLIHPVAAMVRRADVAAVGGFDERLQVNEDWELFLRLGRRGVRWACIDEALCEYRVHAAQSHRRVALVLATRVEILARFFADASLPPRLRTLAPEAFQRAYLQGAAELYATGSTDEAQRAFVAAVRARPAFVREPASLRWFARVTMPTGRQNQDEAARRWDFVLRSLLDGLAAAARGPDPALSAGDVWAARVRALALAGRLCRRRVAQLAGRTHGGPQNG